LKKQQKLQVDPLLFHENMLQRLKLCFQLSVKYLAVKKVKQLGLSFTEIFERRLFIQHILQDENIAKEWK